ncbi:MAG: SoxR reducing system RseC family protein [Odoribacteraceae bacterium]|nr:SoxR reducing system RseC family protein [Odoribacteraceae bacterium]
MGNVIEHEGTVTRVEGDAITVSIERAAACEGCRARGACGNPADGTREIVVRQPGTRARVGERATVRVSGGRAARAVLLAYAIPSVLAIGTVAALSTLAGDVTAAIAALVAVAGYFCFLFFRRERLSREITFTIELP